MSDIDLRHISKRKSSSGIKQAIILVLVVIIGILISVSSDAQNLPEDKIQKEDAAIAKNNLPSVSLEMHKQICSMVTESLKNKMVHEPIELSPLYFTFNQDEISGVDMKGLLTAVEYALQGRIILIEGHTDNWGELEYNVKLSIKRVQKIRDLMHDLGVSDEQISIMGYGEEIAQYNNKTPQGRHLNRRVDFKAY